MHLESLLARPVATADGSCEPQELFLVVSWVKALRVQAIKGRGPAALPHCPAESSPLAVLRFHVDLLSNGWPLRGQRGGAQHQGHQRPQNSKTETPGHAVPASLLQRDLGDVAFKTAPASKGFVFLFSGRASDQHCSESSLLGFNLHFGGRVFSCLAVGATFLG